MQPARRGWLALLAGGEPFRLCFPLAVLAGWVAVGLWPAYVFGWTGTYPGVAHARVMVEGFVGLAIMGFLGTALPRVLEVPGLVLAESFALAGGGTTAVVLHLAGAHATGDAVFALTLVLLVLLLGGRFLFRRDLPPPSFVLVLLGLVSGLVGSAGLFVVGVAPGTLPPEGVAFMRLLLYQGFPLYPMLGVGAFLLPRFFGVAHGQETPVSRIPDRRWAAAAGLHLLAGLLLLVGFGLEARGEVRFGNLLRAAVLAVHLGITVPFLATGLRGGSLALALRVALASLPLGHALIAAWPAASLGLLHVVMIQGVGLAILAVASRVLLGHGGRGAEFARWSKALLVVLALVILATATRVSADWLPAVRLTHYAYAALVWMIAVALWAGRHLPLAREE